METAPWKHSQAQSKKYNKNQSSFPVALYRAYTYTDINLLLCSSFLLHFLWPNFVYIDWLSIFETQDLQLFTSCVIHHSWISMGKKKIQLIFLFTVFWLFFVMECFIEEEEEPTYFRVSPNPAFPLKCSQIDPDHLFENRLHTAEECITCSELLHILSCVFTFFQRGKKSRFFPDKDIFCFWWMKLVCISLETANNFTLGTGMKPSIR